MKSNNDEIVIRMATPEDAAALVSIYAPYVLETGITFEYDVPSFAFSEALYLSQFP